MGSVRKGLRAGDVERDTYERLVCGDCDETLDTRSPPDRVGTVRRCPDCGREWQQLK